MPKRQNVVQNHVFSSKFRSKINFFFTRNSKNFAQGLLLKLRIPEVPWLHIRQRMPVEMRSPIRSFLFTPRRRRMRARARNWKVCTRICSTGPSLMALWIPTQRRKSWFPVYPTSPRSCHLAQVVKLLRSASVTVCKFGSNLHDVQCWNVCLVFLKYQAIQTN